jgi:hypothetical protein
MGGVLGPFVAVVEAELVLTKRIIEPTLLGWLKNGDRPSGYLGGCMVSDSAGWTISGRAGKE